MSDTPPSTDDLLRALVEPMSKADRARLVVLLVERGAL